MIIHFVLDGKRVALSKTVESINLLISLASVPVLLLFLSNLQTVIQFSRIHCCTNLQTIDALLFGCCTLYGLYC